MGKDRALFDDRAAEYDQSAFHWQLAEFVAARVPTPAGAVLDVGTGTGLALRALSDRDDVSSRTGVDVSSRMLDVARAEMPDALLVQAPAEHLPFAAESFDVVLCVAALPYVFPEQAASEWRRVLRPGGAVVVTAHETDGVTSSRLLRQAGRELGIDLIDPNAATGSRHALSTLSTAAGFRLANVEVFVDRRPARISEATFDLQLRYFGEALALTNREREVWRERYLEIAARIDIEAQRVLVATLMR